MYPMEAALKFNYQNHESSAWKCHMKSPISEKPAPVPWRQIRFQEKGEILTYHQKNKKKKKKRRRKLSKNKAAIYTK